MRFAIDFSDPNRLLFSSDHPWVQPQEILKPFYSLNLSTAEQKKILTDNARNLFRI
jgi:predicted TIM-barrel fold metal-dependent hydrolase